MAVNRNVYRTWIKCAKSIKVRGLWALLHLQEPVAHVNLMGTLVLNVLCGSPPCTCSSNSRSQLPFPWKSQQRHSDQRKAWPEEISFFAWCWSDQRWGFFPFVTFSVTSKREYLKVKCVLQYVKRSEFSTCHHGGEAETCGTGPEHFFISG